MDETTRVDVVLVGAGPIGLELAASFTRQGVSYLHFDAGQIGQTFTWWPRNTRFFSTSERIAIAGIPIQTQDQEHITGEMYLAYLRAVVEQLDLQVRVYEPVLRIWRGDKGFTVETERHGKKHLYASEKVVIASGDMHKPRMLNIPGEELPHVTHYFTDPHRYFRTNLLIVGGRNSAIEAALRCFRVGAQVSISYRRDSFNPDFVKPHLLPDVQAQIRNGTIAFHPATQLIRIDPGVATLMRGEDTLEVNADFVLICTGFLADQALLEQAGVDLRGEMRTPVFDPASMETNVPGLYVAGTATAGIQSRYTVFIENAHQHVGRIVQAITGSWPKALGTIPGRQYDLEFEEYKRN